MRRTRDGESISLYRAKASCRIAKKALNGETPLPDGVSMQDWTMYNLLSAIEDIAEHLHQQDVAASGGEGEK